MAGTDDANTTETRHSPTTVLRLLIAEGLSAPEAADRLNTEIRTNKRRLWCNGNLLPVDYIVTSLVVVARPEADGRWRADVVSSRNEAWQQPPDFYVFELGISEGSLPPAASLQAPNKKQSPLVPAPSAKQRRTGSAQRVINEAALEIYRGALPELLAPAKLRHDIIAWQKHKTPKNKKPPDPPSWDACKRYLQKCGILKRG
jgi:hypothetical protein